METQNDVLVGVLAAMQNPPGIEDFAGAIPPDEALIHIVSAAYGELADALEDGPLAGSLERILKGKITEYHSEFVDEGCDFITKFPKDLQFKGWVVRLGRNGHQTEHIHTTGWLSGVFYLEVPKSKDPEEGAIELGLWGHDYHILDENYPRVRYHPKPGGLVLFPSSLFHATIPHQNDEARLCIAFDLLPSRTR